MPCAGHVCRVPSPSMWQSTELLTQKGAPMVAFGTTSVGSVPRHIRATLSDRDLEYFSMAVSTGTHELQGEHFHTDRYLDNVIPKPWGLEFRVYADQLYDIWKLTL